MVRQRRRSHNNTTLLRTHTAPTDWARQDIARARTKMIPRKGASERSWRAIFSFSAVSEAKKRQRLCLGEKGRSSEKRPAYVGTLVKEKSFATVRKTFADLSRLVKVIHTRGYVAESKRRGPKDSSMSDTLDKTHN